MFKLECDLVGTTPFSFSAPIQSRKETGEPHDAFEERTWRERIHRDNKGEAFINPMALKNCLSECAKYLSQTVPGKGKATYTKHVEAGVMVMDPLMLGVKADDIPGERLFVPANGQRGHGTRVWRIFPKVDPWKTHATVYVTDPTIDAEKLEEYLGYAGQFIGMGRFRPRNNGFYGKFVIENVAVSDKE